MSYFGFFLTWERYVSWAKHWMIVITWSAKKLWKYWLAYNAFANPERIVIKQSVKTSWEFQESLGNKFGLEKFKEVLRVTDFPAIIQSTEAADSAVRSDPVSLIEDILKAATRQDENLLDCYWFALSCS